MKKHRAGRPAIVALAALVTVGWSVSAAEAASTPRAPVSVVASTTYDTLYSLTSDSAGHVYAVDYSTGAVLKFNGVFQSPSVIATDTLAPRGVTWHGGLLYISNNNGSISTVPATGGTLTTLVAAPSVSGGEAAGQQLSWDSAGNLYVSNYNNNVIGMVAPGASTETTLGLHLPTACDPFGTLIYAKTLYVACYGTGKLVKAAMPITPGELTTVVPTPRLTDPGEMVMDAHHSLYVLSVRSDSLVKVPLTGKATYVATTGTELYSPWGLAAVGNTLYTALKAEPNVLAKVALPVTR
ncbi:MAG TPA: hypothetical protein VGS61_06210 [Acidimicrobiales bacterium]|nr:hypothetical protein [Acidimicrobiales bacterium]